MVETSEDLSKSELKKLIATKLDQYPNYYNPSDIIKVLAIPRTQNGKKIRNEARIAKYLDELSKLN